MHSAVAPAPAAPIVQWAFARSGIGRTDRTDHAPQLRAADDVEREVRALATELAELASGKAVSVGADERQALHLLLRRKPTDEELTNLAYWANAR